MDVARRLAGDAGTNSWPANRNRCGGNSAARFATRSCDGRAEYVRHRPLPASEGDGDPRWDLYAMCEAVAQASWQSHVTNGNTLTHERVREYFRDAHDAAARLGWSTSTC